MGLNVNNIVDELWALYPIREEKSTEIATTESLMQTLSGAYNLPTAESEQFLDFSMDMIALQNLYGVSKPQSTEQSVLDNLPDGLSKFLINGDDITIYKNQGTRIAQAISDAVVNFENIYREIETNRYMPVSTVPVYAETTGASGVNGEIDEYIKQGQTGDCWIISGIIALNSTNEGKQIIKNSITINEDGSATVSFKGAQASYRITAEDIKRFDTDNNTYDCYSNGDNDMLILELAVERLKKDVRDGKVSLGLSEDTYEGYHNNEYSIEGGFAQQLIYLMTGKTSETYIADGETTYDLADGLSNDEVYSVLRDAANHPGTVLTIGLYYDVKHANCVDGKVFNIDLTNGGHALAVTNVDEENQTVTIVNPWDSTEEFTMSWAEFANLGIGQISSTKLDANDTEVNTEDYYYNDGEGYVDNYFNMNEYYSELMALFNAIYDELFRSDIFGYGDYSKFFDIFDKIYDDYLFI